MWMRRQSYFLSCLLCKLFTFSCFLFQLLFPFSPVVGEKDTAAVPVLSLSESVPSKIKTQSESLEDELELDLELDNIGSLVSINSKHVKVCRI
jgi:hypothetical protein